MEAKGLCMISIGSFNLKVSSLQAVKVWLTMYTCICEHNIAL